MREILYHGKRKDNGEWVEGWYAKSGDKTFILIDNDIAVGYVTMIEVIPESVGQYTGLTDKNGNKIFEGYIVSGISTYYKRLIVEFFDGAFVIKNKGNHIRAPLYHYCHLIEVIGNVIDNPELLEVANG